MKNKTFTFLVKNLFIVILFSSTFTSAKANYSDFATGYIKLYVKVSPSGEKDKVLFSWESDNMKNCVLGKMINNTNASSSLISINGSRKINSINESLKISCRSSLSKYTTNISMSLSTLQKNKTLILNWEAAGIDSCNPVQIKPNASSSGTKEKGFSSISPEKVSEWICYKSLAPTKTFYATSTAARPAILNSSSSLLHSSSSQVAQLAIKVSSSSLSSLCINSKQNIVYGITSTNVVRLQRFLVSTKLLSEQPTGFYGIKTKEAIKLYQKNMKLSQSGLLDDPTLQAIKKQTCK